MSQNTSTAVMQRRSEPHKSLDDFPTPPWATRALCEFLKARALIGPLDAVREPAANRGHMAGPLGEYFEQVLASDIHDYGAEFEVRDYLFGEDPSPVPWTITNPPFRLAEEFIARALATSTRGVAMIVRSAFLEGVGRHDRLFSVRPPRYVLQFSERVVMHKGKLSEKGSTETSYSWLIWGGARHDYIECELLWVPPRRRELERTGDYPPEPVSSEKEGALI